MQQVLVLNASYEPLNVTTVRRAHVLVFKGKAEGIEELEQPLRSAPGAFPWPPGVRLVPAGAVSAGDQTRLARARAADAAAQDLARGALRPRRLAVHVLGHRERPPHARP